MEHEAELIDYLPVNTFTKVHQDTNRYLFVRGPVGSGKSSGCIWQCVLNSWKQLPKAGVRKSRYAIIRASYPALKSTVIKSWEKWFPGLFKPVFDVPIRAKMTYPHFDGKTKVEMELVFIALDREEEVKKLQSLEVTGIHINEAAETAPGILNMCKSRFKRYPDPEWLVDPFVILDYNSVDTDHWLYKLAEEDKPPEHSFYVQPPGLLMIGQDKYKNNPEADNWGHTDAKSGKWIRHLMDDYYLDQVHGTDSDWVNVFLLNNYGMVRKGKPVYPEYTDNLHFDKKLTRPLDGVPILIGQDLGLTPACSFSQLTPTGKLITFDEIVEEDMSIQEFAKNRLKSHIANNYRNHTCEVIIDPAGGARNPNDKKTGLRIFKDNGFSVRLASTNETLARREAVVYFLNKRDGFAIGPNAPVLRKGFISEFHYPRYSAAALSAKYHEKPDKNIYSHVHDGQTYSALELSEGRVTKRRAKKKISNHGPASSVGY